MWLPRYLMKTTRFLLPGFLFGSLVCCALAAPQPQETLFGTNVVLSLRPLVFEPRDEQSLPHTEDQLRTVLEHRRLSLDVRREVPVPGAGKASVEWAERFNAEAMRRYREQWEGSLGAPSALHVPVLYRSKVEENQ